MNMWLFRCSHGEHQGDLLDYQSLLQDKVDQLRLENRYRHFVELERLTGQHPHALWHTDKGPRDVIIWCSNDYLGMGQSSMRLQPCLMRSRPMARGRRHP